jgi:hypothetical protein
MPKRTWTDDQLVDAVATSGSLAGVMVRLGLRPGRYPYIRTHIDRLGIDASHIPSLRGSLSGRPRSWSDEDLVEVVARSSSFAEVMRTLGYVPSGGIHRWLKAIIRSREISTEHFTGQAWSRGLSLPGRPRRTLEELLVQGSTATSGELRKKLIKAELKPAHCEECGLAEWRGKPLPLALDHINGDPMDNRLENLRILCPNCHAQTPTWCARNRKRWPA